MFIDHLENPMAQCGDSCLVEIVTSKLAEAKVLAQKLARIFESIIAVEIESKPHIGLLSTIFIEDTWSLRKVGDAMTTCKWFQKEQ